MEMNLKKKELIFTIIMAIVFLFVVLNLSVLATDDSNSATLNWTIGENNNNTSDNTINIVDNNTENTNTDTDKDGEINTINTNTNNTNATSTLSDTGLEDLPWVIIGICAISIVFAYKKIKEYNEI